MSIDQLSDNSTTLTALTPQMTVVLPTLTTAEPSAVVTVPMLKDTGRNSSRPRPSGLTSWPYTHTKYICHVSFSLEFFNNKITEKLKYYKMLFFA